MSESAILGQAPLGFPWQTFDPFLFCVHHDDAYPAGNEAMGPAASLAGRNLGMDFEVKDGWRMYHGDVVPGFPRHPHRGFETVTLARRGFIDHADSLGATARFGHGDVQWMTAGRGVVHSEMFPLVHRDADNPTELFQIWLNLPSEHKMADAHFAMLWADAIPRHELVDANGRAIRIVTVAGELGGREVPSPPPKSWAARPDSDVAIWTVELAASARWTLPAARPGSRRALYFHTGDAISIGGQPIRSHGLFELRADVEVELVAGNGACELLLLGGRPIGEPVAQHGPFVMNSRQEIQEAMLDFHRTGFGGWPWDSDGPVHPRDEGRFAIHADGRLDRPAQASAADADAGARVDPR